MLEALHLIELDRNSRPRESKVPKEIALNQLGLSRQESDLASNGRTMNLQMPRRSTLSYMGNIQMPELNVHMSFFLHEAGVTGCE
jgi:hypothetical protein